MIIMHTVLLQSRLSEPAIRQLIDEFPQFFFLAPRELSYKNLGDEEWSNVEILYGNRLTSEELEKAHQLRWIHSPTSNLSPLCLHDIEKKGNIILTVTKEENVVQIGEFVLAGILTFAKQLFQWKEADKAPVNLLNSRLREVMWTLQDRVLLQIGLGDAGSAIARSCKQMGMKVWGVQEQRSFHPHCRKTFSYKELHSALPQADVVCLAIPRGKMLGESWFGEKEFELMKQDSIFVLIGSKNMIDEEALLDQGLKNKFRGILLDLFYQMPIAPASKLWGLSNMIITPEVAPRPKSDEKEAFRTFRYNFRQYLHGNFVDMKIMIGKLGTKGP